jgi:hypothetical protein
VTSLLACMPGVLQLLVLRHMPSCLVQGGMVRVWILLCSSHVELLWMLVCDTCLAALCRDSTSGLGIVHQLVLWLLFTRVQCRA